MSDSHITAYNFFGLSAAYFYAAEHLSKSIDSEVQSEIDFLGSACMFNARLGVELFLKGMILSRNQNAKVGTHTLEKLADSYSTLYPEERFRWNVPFVVQVVGGTEHERTEAIRKAIITRPLDQVFRYPTDNKGKSWEMVSNFNPAQFNQFVLEIIKNTERIKRELSYE